MGKKYIKIRTFAALFTFCLLAFSSSSFASEPVHEETTAAPAENHEFNAGEFIISHVTDKYEWHLWGPHEDPVSIPLPVILYSSEKGWSVFMSSRFEHGKASYNGYSLNHEGGIESENGSSFFDLSITKTVTEILIATVLLLWIFISVAKAYSRRAGQAPKGLQSFIEPIILFVRDDVAKSSIGEKHYRRFLPLLLTIFFFIWINNMLGLIPIFPGGANVTGNIAVTFTLAFLVFLITLFIGNKHYWHHILWMPGVPPLVKILLLTPIEIIGVLQRPFVLMIRLFANIVAGHIVILSFVSLIFLFGSTSAAGGWGFAPLSMAFAVFMNAMELLVAFLQAFVFTLLTAMYIGACVEDPHADDHVAV